MNSPPWINGSNISFDGSETNPNGGSVTDVSSLQVDNANIVHENRNFKTIIVIMAIVIVALVIIMIFLIAKHRSSFTCTTVMESDPNICASLI